MERRRDPESTDVLGGVGRRPATEPATGDDPTLAPPVGTPSPTATPAPAAFEPTLAGVPDAPAAPPPDDDRLPLVDPAHYTKLDEYARGGLGRIVRARDHRTGRIVAIKEMLGDHDEIARRFAREARVTANLQHPSIVPVYELGRWPSGEPFYAMKLVAGESLHQVIARTRRLDERLALLGVVAAVADALAYAHGQHVIHRDLKPANVLVGEFGETVVIDWGLAKVLGTKDRPSSISIEAGGGGDATLAGSVLGTPHYMPPEQARGNEADERADVYAIGAMLYHLITGRGPFADRGVKDVTRLLALVQDERPTPIATLEPGTPPDLVTIIEKAMARDREDRYPSARELSDDLRRFTAGQLVRAHRYDRATLVKRWLRRNRAAVTVGVSLVAVLAVGAVISVRSIIEQRDRAEARRAEATAATATALFQKGRAAEQQQRWLEAASYYAAARGYHDTPAARWAGGLAEARAIAPVARHLGHTDTVTGAALSPDGERVATIDRAGALRVWRRADGTLVAERRIGEPLWSIAYAPDGTELAVGGDRGVVRRLSANLEPVAEHRGHVRRVWTLAYAPDGSLLASGGEDASIRLWPRRGGEPRVLAGHTQRVYSVDFAPDGARLASSSDDRSVWLWDVASGRGALRGTHRNGGVRVVRFSRSGGHVLTSGWDFVINLWPTTGDGKPTTWSDTLGVHGAAISPDERVVITAGDSGQLKLWETSTRAQIATIELPGGRTNAVATSRDGRWLVTGGDSKVPVVWDLGALPRLVDAVGHRGAVHELAMTPDGTRFVTVADDQTIRVWRIADLVEELRIPIDLYCAAPHLANGVIAAACEDHTVRRWNLRGEELGRTQTEVYLRRGSLSPDGTTLALGHMKGHVALLELATGKLLTERALHDHQVYSVQYGPKGLLATAALDSRVKVWTTPDLTLVRELAIDTEDGTFATGIDPTGTLVVAGSQDGSLEVWRIATGERLARVTEHAGAIWGALWSPDGRHVYTAGDDGRLRIWDPATWRVIATLDAGEANALALAISPDGKTAITGHRTSAVVVWDLVTRRPRFRLGGNARDHGSCEDVSQQRWVDDTHRAIVEAACRSEPHANVQRIEALTKLRVEGVDTQPAWPGATPSP